MDYFPVSLNIKKFRTLIVGGGKVATQKATRLATYTEQATVVAPHISEALRVLPFQYVERPFQQSDLEGIQLLFICTDNYSLNHEISLD